MEVKIRTDSRIINDDNVKALIVEAGNSYFETFIGEDEEVDIAIDNSNGDIFIKRDEDGNDGEAIGEEPEFKVEGEIYSDKVVIRLVNREGDVVREMDYGGEIVKLVKGLTYLSSFTSAII
jgi:hypothetical protein